MASLGDFFRFPADVPSQAGTGGTSSGSVLLQAIHAVQDRLGIPEWNVPSAAGAASAPGAAFDPNQGFQAAGEAWHSHEVQGSTDSHLWNALAAGFHWDLV